MKSILNEENAEQIVNDFYEKYCSNGLIYQNYFNVPIFDANGNYIKIWDRDTEKTEIKVQQTNFIL